MNFIASSIGTINLPTALDKFQPVQSGGISQLLNIAVQGLIAMAGIYALFNFILAGYGFLSAGDDPKKMQGASAKIWQSVLGLTVAAGSIVLAAIFGYLIYKDPNAILNPTIPTP